MFFKYNISDAVQEWIYDNFVWAIRLRLLTPDTPLVFTTKEFFTAPKGEGDVVVSALLDDIQHILGMRHKAFNVLPVNALPAEMQIDYNALSAVAGSWQDDDNVATIRYDPNLLNNPIGLISVLTHELMHDVLHGIADYPPGGEEAEELNTDLHCITMGFGVLQITYAQNAGWAGYMRQNSRIHALAMFVLVRELSQEDTMSALPSANRRQFKKAIKALQKEPEKITFLQERLHQERPELPHN
jgi:hypothetical protein